MSTTTMHFGPEWMRTKHQPLSRSQPPASPPLTSATAGLGLSTYSTLVSATPPSASEAGDDAHPFRYSKDELLRIYQEGGGKGGLGLEVERWEGVVREPGIEPVALREMSETEKKLFAGPLNSEIRRRASQSTDFLSPLNTTGLERPRLPHSVSSSTNSPLRERFGALKRRDSSTTGNADSLMLNLPRKPSLSALQSPGLSSPREASPRTRVGYTNFDGVLNNADSWAARRRSSEATSKPGTAPIREGEIQKASGIQEEKEDSPQTLSSRGEDQPAFASSSPHLQNEQAQQHPAAVGGTAAGNGIQNNLPQDATSTANAPTLGDIGPPPGLIDFAAVEWSYKDPTGQIQGPFRADLMQKWYDDGYFTPDLPMKRIRYDTNWTTVQELLSRANGGNIFLTPPAPAGSINHGSPLQSYPSSDNVFNEPFQPSPIRTLRASALDSYYAGSAPSDSPSPSFGSSQYGNPSPDPSFGGREAKPYYSGDPTSRFAALNIQDHAPFNGGRMMNTDYQQHQGPSFGNFIGERDIGYNGYYNGHPVPQDPWMMHPNTAASPLYMGGREGRPGTIQNDLHGRPFGQGSPFVNDGMAAFNNHLPSNAVESYPQYGFLGQGSFQAAPEQQHYPTSELNGNGPARASTLGFRGVNDEIVASPTPQHDTAMPAVSSPWKTVVEPVQTSQTVAAPVAFAPVINTTSIPLHSPWGPVEDIPPQTSEATVVPITLPTDTEGGTSEAVAAPKLVPESQIPPSHALETVEPILEETPSPSEEVAKPTQPSGKASRKSTQVVQPPAPVPEPTFPDASPAPVALKAPWAKEDEGKKKKNAAPSFSLREIQEAEAQKLEAKKAAERDKERLARASVVTDSKEDTQPFIASWGLPTSQAGGRGSTPLREAAPVPTPASVATPVWTTPAKAPAVKKTMKEIQEEEETRKKLATKEALASVAAVKRGYAETTTKVAVAPPLSSSANNVWTTVGPSGKASSPAAAPVRPGAQVTPGLAAASSSSVAKVANVPQQRTVASSALKTRPAVVNDVPEAPSHDFLKWVSDSLKGLNSSVNVEEIISMLLSFPLDPDPSTVEIISDTIYSNSTTLDGRRFASEFVAKRKADVRSKHTSTPGKASAKPVSIADVVKATPKATQPEWGFKVVNKKKKGNRA
ncbi:hypothetical protein D9619_003116 [Psilocybe cf. subviscida]|uniref:GYF domain-containing protein n=1 Tax=Psilocybe cf. subviscida TaxID=2480587 RepID=A0A8H5EUD8_9AGAR|nr:hypothetical protein D9619_003116 [Psilocybe cf. subviscida]